MLTLSRRLENLVLMRIPFLVYAAFRATVHVIDHAKKALLGRLLAESVTSTAPGETIEEKLAALTFSHSSDRKS